MQSWNPTRTNIFHCLCLVVRVHTTKEPGGLYSIHKLRKIGSHVKSHKGITFEYQNKFWAFAQTSKVGVEPKY
jgi:hypothetical protein